MDFNLNPNYVWFSWLVFAVFGISFIIQLFYYIRFNTALIFYKPETSKLKQEPVSIIICAKDEGENLQKFLPMILEQDYPDYEVIVVNDRSEDNTEYILEVFKKKYSFLYSTQIKENFDKGRGKKLALTIGIKAAKNELLLFTDADCQIKSTRWLAEMQKNFKAGIQIVLGYGAYKEKEGMLNKFIRTDTSLIAIQYLNYSLRACPYMGIGRNIAYRKSLFFSNKGFASHYHLDSGDDDLFVNETATSSNTAIEISEESFTWSEPPTSFNEWLGMKKRHFTTSKYYKPKYKLLLGLELLSRILFYTNFVILCSLGSFLWITLLLFFFRLLFQIVLFKLSLNRLNEKNLLLYSLFYDILFPVFGLYIRIRKHSIDKLTR
ncbi:glycosyltransferase [Bacteroidota bacterium]